MFSIHGQIVNTFYTPASEKYPEPSYKVQLLGDHVTKDGQVRAEMLDLSPGDKITRTDGENRLDEQQQKDEPTFHNQ